MFTELGFDSSEYNTPISSSGELWNLKKDQLKKVVNKNKKILLKAKLQKFKDDSKLHCLFIRFYLLETYNKYIKITYYH